MSSDAVNPMYHLEAFDEEALKDIEPVNVRSIYELIGGGYEQFWHWQGRYRVLMGS